MVAGDQLLRNALCDIGVGAGIVTGYELDLDTRRQVFLMLLDVELDALVELVAGLRERTGIVSIKPILTVCAAAGIASAQSAIAMKARPAIFCCTIGIFLSRFLLVYRE